MRMLLSPKSEIYTEGMVVDAAGISAQTGVHYLGRPRYLPLATGVESRGDG